MDALLLYNFAVAERKWQEFWKKEKIYAFDLKKSKKIYSVDTPPPTLSGKMHIGHAYSYSQQDFIVRYHRMRGEGVFYPFGTDDNGLPTERLVERLKGVKSHRMQRKDFVELCYKTILEVRDDFIDDWVKIGMSCDFSHIYSTIDKHSIETSQRSFIDLYKKGLVYQKEETTMWCVNCKTAIAQAELSDSERTSLFVDVEFRIKDGGSIIVSTTRPELLGACVCIYVNPKDKRYKSMVGHKAVVPLFLYEVPILSDISADIKKGSGAMMVCSYGDKFDVLAIKKRKLESRIIFDKDGKLNNLAGKYKGLSIKEARAEIIADLEHGGLLKGKTHIKHVVNVHDRCGTDVEFLDSRQWFVRILENKKLFLSGSKKIKWHPPYMKKRYTRWVEDLEWDWSVSRQRHFGVGFPLWYCEKCGEVMLADEDDLPVDVLYARPKKKCKCGSSSFVCESDVMDTWATSSLTPHIVLDWIKEKKGPYLGVDFKRMYPMSIRPQAHDIIRTWAFYTIVRGLYHNKEIPWSDIVISGHVLDPKGEAMHKSKGNVIDPRAVLDKYGADALRFWASSSRLGEDMRYMEKDLVSGQRFVTKLWNASKFIINNLEGYNPRTRPKKLEVIDRFILSELNKVVKECTRAFDIYEYVKARLVIENFFWHSFCDNYLEIVKDRIYNSQKRGVDALLCAQYTLYTCLLSILKLIAPIMPHITEEIYQRYFRKFEHESSIHVSIWPKYLQTLEDKQATAVGVFAFDILGRVRQYKSSNRKSLKEEVVITLHRDDEHKFNLVYDDLKATCNAREIKFGDSFRVEF